MLTRIRKATQDKDQGFTLIELLVVMIIIGILAAIAIPTFLNQRKNGYRSALKSDLKNAATALESWAVDRGGAYDAPAGSTDTAANVLKDTSQFTPSEGVSVSVLSATKDDYCLKADHTSLSGEPWYYTKLKSGTEAAAGVPMKTVCA